MNLEIVRGEFHTQSTLFCSYIPITCLVFKDLLTEDDIKTLIYDISSSVMESEETNTEEHDEREHKEDDAEIEEETDGDEKEHQEEEGIEIEEKEQQDAI